MNRADACAATRTRHDSSMDLLLVHMKRVLGRTHEYLYIRADCDAQRMRNTLIAVRYSCLVCRGPRIGQGDLFMAAASYFEFASLGFASQFVTCGRPITYICGGFLSTAITKRSF